MALAIGPSKQRERWRDFFIRKQWSPEEFHSLLRADDPGAAFFEIETQINGLYRGVQVAHQMRHQRGMQPDPEQLGIARQKARWIEANAHAAREALGPLQRQLNLGLMTWMRRSACLSLVVGAGVTMDAGGPSWSALVRRLLMLALERGREITEMRERSGGASEQRNFESVVTAVKRLDAQATQRAWEILAAIDAKQADTELLMEGTQLCHALMEQHLFTDITSVLYEHNRRPGPIHKAIAELAAPQYVRERGGWFSGWDSIITYNFDDLLGEALDESGLARAAYAMRGDELGGDPNAKAVAGGKSGLHQHIYHLHGYTPRKLFLITQMQYVFSTSQYLRTYAARRSGIIDYVLKNWLANPVHHALYVGCSFEDEAMNDLLREAATALPGRYHYALLKWQGGKPYPESSADEIAFAAARYETLGVRPLWFDSFEEIPVLLRRLI